MALSAPVLLLVLGCQALTLASPVKETKSEPQGESNQGVPTRSGCTYNGVQYQVGDDFQDDCNTCHCTAAGVVFCTEMACGRKGSAVARYGLLPRIVGGQEAEPHQFPWQISLKYLDIWPHHYHTCGATIVDSTHIVCAAHCISGRQKGWFQVVAGAHNIHSILPEDTIQKRKVADMWKHEGYDSHIITNDVSVLKLDEPLEFNEYVQPLPLAPKGDDPAGGTICINSGWGSTSHSSVAQMPNKLQFVEMPIVSRPDCQEDYSGVNGVDEGMICAGIDEGGISACSGDSGGPFACPNENGTLYLSGIVSWGMIPCGQANRPSVYTNVGYFRDWIDEHLAL